MESSLLIGQNTESTPWKNQYFKKKPPQRSQLVLHREAVLPVAHREAVLQVLLPLAVAPVEKRNRLCWIKRIVLHVPEVVAADVEGLEKSNVYRQEPEKESK